jgi:meso-butanediol dehydrogenase/(S,S)-butanediol dehydrogenase/diacetyl reductase
MSFDGQKIALVTGAARGIGLATSKLFVQQGYQVAMVDRDEEALFAEEKNVPGGRAFLADISDEIAVSQMMTDVLKWSGRLDVLVNNAGVADFGPIEETDFERWRTVFATNLDGTFLCSQAATPHLKECGGGAIVNIASISGIRASTLRVAYGTSKAAIIHLTQQQAVELGEFGIRANCVAPGPVRTKLSMAVHSQDIIEAYHDAIPLNRYGREDEIASAIVYLVSDAASYITGQTLSVDGGFEAAGVGLPALRN